MKKKMFGIGMAIAATAAGVGAPLAMAIDSDYSYYYDEDITITVPAACNVSTTRSSGNASYNSSTNTYSKTMSVGSVDTNFGTLTLSAYCNSYSGSWKVSGTFANLTNSSNSSHKITYDTSADPSSSHLGYWVAKTGSTRITSGSTLLSGSGVVTSSSPLTKSITYLVSISNTQAAGTYTATSPAVYAIGAV